MKAQLLVNLKIGRGVIVTKGAVYSDIDGELPEFVNQNIDNPKIFRIIDAAPAEAPAVELPEDETPEDETPEDETPEEPPAKAEPADEAPADEATSKKALSRRK